ncbi:glycosyltransferase [Natronorubrum texcoconense]|nr:glycosyltransferase family 4 protein [Natronorubrum texcoconense]
MSEGICFVSDTIHSYFNSRIESGVGGAERQQYMLATALRDRGYDVSVLTLKYGSTQRKTVDGIDVFCAIPDVRGVSRAPFKLIQTVRGLRSIDADVYYVRGNDFLCMATASYACMSGGGFVYAVANDSNVDPALLESRGVLRYPYIRAMRSADTVVAQTSHQQQLLSEEHGIDAPIIPNGYDVPPESELIAHADREHVLWVGSMDPDQKRPERFLALARQLPEIQFRMIGPPDNDHPDYSKKIAADARTLSNLDFLGFVDPDEIHDHYRDAIALVNTSDYEGFPNVFLEAWRYATPVVSLHHTLDGILIDEPVGIHAGSMNALVEAIEQLAVDTSVCERLGFGGRRHMIDHYAFDRLLDRYERVLTDVSRRN